MSAKLGPHTRVSRTPVGDRDPFHASAPPIYQTATFAQDDPAEFGEYDYSRSGNPTRTLVEEHVAALEGGACGTAFASGMAAISASLRLVGCGDRVVVGDDLYGGTYRLLGRILAPLGVEIVRADTRDLEETRRAIAGGRTRLVWIETPSNPLQEVTDLRATASLAHEAGALLAVDNTMLSPWLQQPIRHGADLVVHSATKWLCGHADVTAGVVVTRTPELGARIRFVQNAEGSALGPFDAWLLLRGMKTLGLRVERQQATAATVASFLRAHPAVCEVLWVGFADHPDRAVHDRQATGPGAVLSFRTGSDAASREVALRARLFATTVSFGSLHSTISLPCRMSHASIPADQRARRSIPTDLVRLSVGIEDACDLVADLDAALGHADSLDQNAARLTAPEALPCDRCSVPSASS